MSLQTIAKALKTANIPVRSVTEGDDSVDSEIEITDRLSVQVGWPRAAYVVVSCWIDDETLESRPERKPRDVAAILEDLYSFGGRALKLEVFVDAVEAAGFPIKELIEGFESEIEIDDRLSVQVGWPTPFHVTVSCWVNDGEDLESRDPRKPEDLAGVIADLKSFGAGS